jgi:hypothetical protein
MYEFQKGGRMTGEEFELQNINLKVDRLLTLMQDKQESKVTDEKGGEWVSLRQACKMHGGYMLSTMRARKELQPCCGKNFRKIGHGKFWEKEDILEWLQAKTPAEIAIYQHRYDSDELKENKDGQ